MTTQTRSFYVLKFGPKDWRDGYAFYSSYAEEDLQSTPDVQRADTFETKDQADRAAEDAKGDMTVHHVRGTYEIED